MGHLETLNRPSPSHSLVKRTEPTYYDMPVVKHSHYGLKTSTAFFLQGVGGASQVIATLADCQGRQKNLQLIRTGRTLALLASPAGPLILISSLHTSRRWYNMLRIFRPTSPMSIGIWTLTNMGLFNSLALAGTALEALGYERQGMLIDRVFGSLAAAAGGVALIYMGTEIEETSMPVWTGAYPHLSSLSASTGFSNGVAALSLASLLDKDSDEAGKRLQRLGSVCAGFQMVFAALMFRKLHLSVGASAIHRRVKAVILPSLLAPAALRVLNMSLRQEALAVAADAAALLGGFSILTSLVLAGKKSGQVPDDYFKLATTRRSLSKTMSYSSYSLSGKDSIDSGSEDETSSKPFDEEVIKPLKATAEDIVQALKSETLSILSDGKDLAANQLTSLAHGLRETGNKLYEKDQQSAAQLAEAGAEQVERLSGYLRKNNLEEMAHDIKDLAKRRPGLFIGGALATGFLLAQLFIKPGESPAGEERPSRVSPSAELGMEE